jgi:hypothetical protein
MELPWKGAGPLFLAKNKLHFSLRSAKWLPIVVVCFIGAGHFWVDPARTIMVPRRRATPVGGGESAWRPGKESKEADDEANLSAVE